MKTELKLTRPAKDLFDGGAGKSRGKMSFGVPWLSTSAEGTRNQVSYDPKAPVLFLGEPGSRSVGKKEVSLPHTATDEEIT